MLKRKRDNDIKKMKRKISELEFERDLMRSKLRDLGDEILELEEDGEGIPLDLVKEYRRLQQSITTMHMALDSKKAELARLVEAITLGTSPKGVEQYIEGILTGQEEELDKQKETRKAQEEYKSRAEDYLRRVSPLGESSLLASDDLVEELKTERGATRTRRSRAKSRNARSLDDEQASGEINRET